MIERDIESGDHRKSHRMQKATVALMSALIAALPAIVIGTMLKWKSGFAAFSVIAFLAYRTYHAPGPTERLAPEPERLGDTPGRVV
jgi:hypothetical protein